MWAPAVDAAVSATSSVSAFQEAQCSQRSQRTQRTVGEEAAATHTIQSDSQFVSQTQTQLQLQSQSISDPPNDGKHKVLSRAQINLAAARAIWTETGIRNIENVRVHHCPQVRKGIKNVRETKGDSHL